MQILISILLAVFFITTILFLIFFLKKKKEKDQLQKEKDQLNTNYNNLLKNFNNFKNELFINRIGYYYDSVTLLSKEEKDAGKSGEKYNCTVHIKELDRYTNGDSKIQLLNVELTSGFDANQFEWVKQCIRNKFSSIKKTADIEWLESEIEIKELRKNKLEKLENLLNNEDGTTL